MKWVSKNVIPIFNNSLARKNYSTYEDSLCDLRSGTN